MHRFQDDCIFIKLCRQRLTQLRDTYRTQHSRCSDGNASRSGENGSPWFARQARQRYMQRQGMQMSEWFAVPLQQPSNSLQMAKYEEGRMWPGLWGGRGYVRNGIGQRRRRLQYFRANSGQDRFTGCSGNRVPGRD